MNEFPTHPDIRLVSIAWVEKIFNYAVLKGDASIHSYYYWY